MIGAIHIVVKNADDFESDFIFSEKMIKSGQNWCFFKAYRNVEKETYPAKLTFLTISGQPFWQNKIRYGFFEKFHGDRYIGKHI